MDTLIGIDRQRMLRQLWRMAEYLECWAQVPMGLRPATLIRRTGGEYVYETWRNWQQAREHSHVC